MGIGGIGGIGGAYGVGSIYPSYVYNPNTVSANSMDKLSRISDDVLDKKIDYSDMAEKENQNPLKKGQTIDFEGIVAKQMQQGQNRAAKLMPKGVLGICIFYIVHIRCFLCSSGLFLTFRHLHNFRTCIFFFWCKSLRHKLRRTVLALLHLLCSA